MVPHNIFISEIYFTRWMLEDKKQRITVRMRINYKASQTEKLSKVLVGLRRETRQAPGHISFDILRSTGQPVSFL